jgi:hypothetical protein
MPISQSCMHCKRLGNCKVATAEMIREDKGCGDWSIANVLDIDARYIARKVAGARAIEAMLLKNPPSSKPKSHRSK